MDAKKKEVKNGDFLDESSGDNENELDEFLDDEFEEEDSGSDKT